MQVHLLVNRGRALRWHLWLADALSATGAHGVVFVPQSSPAWGMLPTSCDLLLRLERLVFRFTGEHATDPVTIEGAGYCWVEQESSEFQADLVINLSSDAFPDIAATTRVLTPLFDGAFGETAAFAGFLDLRPVEIAVTDSARPGFWWSARPAIEQRQQLTPALDNVYARLAELIVQVVGKLGLSSEKSGQVRSRASAELSEFSVPTTAVTFLFNKIQAGIQARIGRLLKEAPRWSVAHRSWNGEPLSTNACQNSRPFSVLPDDGQRYFADPFVFSHKGTPYLFCEEYPFAEQRGVISVSNLQNGSGTFSPPEVVLDEQFHLSYPFVFTHNDEIWMIPETAQANRVALYRAVKFPTKWICESILIDGVRGYDATLVRRKERWWLLMTTRRWQSSSHDNLVIYTAKSLIGPWTPMAGNPQLIDAKASRSAGGTWEYQGKLYRPAQDCSLTYGGGLSVCRIDRLELDQYAQTIVALVTARSGNTRLGIHTLNTDGGVEAIDVFGPMNGISKATLVVQAQSVEGRAATGDGLIEERLYDIRP